MTCPGCGALSPDDARFCASCGRVLQRPSDERRVATVLFADLVGFTTLSEHTDPEQVKNLVDRCFERLVSVVSSFGGRVDKIIGDAIVALFGAPVAHGDDAERAVRAALRMQDVLAAQAVEEGFDVQMRIGVNTGEVLVGALRAGGDYTAMGDVVNTASRLQTLAAPGQVAVGAATYAATSAVIEYQSLGDLQAKGRDEPVAAWAAKQALVPPGYRPKRNRGPLVGRRSELGMLRNAVDTAVERDRAQFLLLIGDAGLGKSRLAEEVAATAEADHGALVLEGRCVPYGEANVWWPIAEAVRQACRVDANAPPDMAKADTAAIVAGALRRDLDDAEVQRVTAGLLYLMGYEGPLSGIEPQRARDEVTRSVLSLIESYAKRRPVVVVISDLHWADDVVLTVADQLLERMGRYPYVLVATARQGLFDRWSPDQGRHNTVVVNLDPLDRTETGELLEQLAEGKLATDVRDLLVDRSGGNPFFVEELMALVGESGMVGAAEAADELPDTLRGLVSARLDGLDSHERAVLDDAAVWGRRGPIEALERMAEEMHPEDVNLEQALHGLVAKEIFRVEGARWSFRSDLIREVAYGTMTKAYRAQAHSGTAKYLSYFHGGEDADDRTVDVIAHHFAEAANLINEIGLIEGVPADVCDTALEWLERAAKRALGSEMHAVAVRLYGRALDLVTPADERWATYLLGRARSRAEVRDLDGAKADVAEVLEQSEERDDDALHARAVLVLGLTEMRSGEPVAAQRTLDRAVGLLDAIGDLEAMGEALRTRGMSEMYVGDRDVAIGSLREALELSRRIDDRRGEAWSLQNIAWLAFEAGRAGEAEARLEESVAVFREIDDPGGLGWANGLLAWVKFHQGDYEAAETLAEDLLPETRTRGDHWAEGMMHVLLASVRLWSGRSSQALEPAEEAIAVFERIDDSQGELQTTATAARIQATLGRREEAMDLMSRALRMGEDHGGHLAELGASTVVMLSGQLGEPDLARGVVDQITPEDLDPEAIGQSDALVSLGLYWLQQGDPARAQELLEAASRSEGKKSKSPAADAALALAYAAQDRGDDALAFAERVDGAQRATYADRYQAGMAAGLALAARGDRAGSRRRFDELQALVDGTDDRLAQAVVRLADAHAQEAVEAEGAAQAMDGATDRLATLGFEASGWSTVFRLATVGDATPASA